MPRLDSIPPNMLSAITAAPNILLTRPHYVIRYGRIAYHFNLAGKADSQTATLGTAEGFGPASFDSPVVLILKGADQAEDLGQQGICIVPPGSDSIRQMTARRELTRAGIKAYATTAGDLFNEPREEAEDEALAAAAEANSDLPATDLATIFAMSLAALNARLALVPTDKLAEPLKDQLEAMLNSRPDRHLTVMCWGMTYLL